MDPANWQTGDLAILKRRGEPGVAVRVAPGPQTLHGEAVIDLSSEVGRPPGGTVTWLGQSYRLLRPSLADLLGQTKRGAQIVTPKDAMAILYLADVAPGMRVAEAGSGSGALTVVLAHAVGPSGQVLSFDRREDFLENARGNVRRAGYGPRVEFQHRDVTLEGLGAMELDAVILDVPEPWTVVPKAWSALRTGGHLATYTPTYNQLERSVESLRTAGFDDVRSLELIERAIHVGEGGTRPAFDMLGHTGFLASGRKVD